MDVKQRLRSVLRDVYIQFGAVATLKKIDRWKNKGYLTSENLRYCYECVALWMRSLDDGVNDGN